MKLRVYLRFQTSLHRNDINLTKMFFLMPELGADYVALNVDFCGDEKELHAFLGYTELLRAPKLSGSEVSYSKPAGAL